MKSVCLLIQPGDPFHNTETWVCGSNLDYYCCFFALDGSHGANAVLATVAPTVTPHGNTGRGGFWKVVGYRLAKYSYIYIYIFY